MAERVSAKEIFLAAIELPSADERQAYLQASCHGDDNCRRQVEDLLQAHYEHDSRFDRPRIEARQPVPAPADLSETSIVATEQPGAQIGPYKLLEQIGEGGMGVVFMAEQQRPVRRKVALKIIKPGMDSRQVIARFEAERQALAMMDHPHIARVLDAGNTQSQLPYFVMELVRGIPITEYCDQNRLETRDRLKLFISVCQAVQHAHTKGIIHRDLKPSNVLVTLHDGAPTPKIIDFGVAKAINQQLTERTMFTSFAQMVGTPLYMSPEQAEMSGLDIDTRSDIYSLGVLLYELLTGATPFDRARMHEAAYDELRRIIREEEPVKPSTRISTMGDASATVSARRGVDPLKLKQLLRRELDWIVMKTLEKDRTRRYETASALSAEITRYLNGEAVEACPPSAGYRLRKYVRRHRTPVVVAAAFVLFLLASSASAWLLYVDARRARNQALIAQGALKEERDRAIGAERKAAAHALRASREQRRALVEKNRADDRSRELKHRLYDYNVIKAAAAWQDQQLDQAQQLLQDCLPQQRGWEWRYLHRLTSGEQHISLPVAELADFALAPDGQHALTLDALGQIRYVDLTQGTAVWTIKAPQAIGFGMTFSGDGRTAAVSGMSGASTATDVGDGFLKIINVGTGDVLWEVTDPEGVFIWPVISADGEKMAVVRGDAKRTAGELRVLRTSDGEVLWTRPTQPIAMAEFDPLGRFLFVAESSGNTAQAPSTIHCLAIASGDPVWSQKRATTSMLAPSRDGQHLFAGGAGHSLVSCNAATGQQARQTPGPYSDMAFMVRVSPDGKHVFTLGLTSQLTIWDAATHRVHKAIGAVQPRLRLADFTADSKRVAYSSGPNSLVLRDFEPPDSALALSGHSSGFTAFAFHRNGGELVSAGPRPDASMRVWDISTGQELRTAALEKTVNHLALSSDGGLLATGGPDGVKLWDFASAKLLQHWPEIGPVWTVALSPSDEYLAAGGERGLLKVWSVSDRKEILSSPLTGSVDGVDFSPDGRMLVSLTRPGGEVLLWRLGEQQPAVLRPAAGGDEFARGVEFSADGKLVAAGLGPSVEVLDIASKAKLKRLQGASGNSFCLVFDSARNRLYSGDGGGVVSVWNLQTEERLLSLSAHEDFVTTLALSNDGETLVSAGREGTIKLWSTQSPSDELEGRRRTVRQATFAVDRHFSRTSVVREVLESLAADGALDQPTLSTALSIANARAASPSACRSYLAVRNAEQNDFSPVRKNLDQARQAFAGVLERAGLGGRGQASPSSRMSAAQWHSYANSLVEPTTSEVTPEEWIALLSTANDDSAPHELVYLRAMAHARLNQWSSAEADLSRALARVPAKSEIWHEYAYRLAFLRVHLGKWEQYQELCRQTLANFGDTASSKLAERTAKMCLFTSQTGVDVAAAGALADRAMEDDKTADAIKPYYWMAKGVSDLRRDRFADAVKAFETAAAGLEGGTQPSRRTCAAAVRYYLAIALWRLDRAGDARQMLTLAESHFVTEPNMNGPDWNDWMNMVAARTEAMSIIQPSPAATDMGQSG